MTIREAARMTTQGRKDIATWLREHAKWLIKYGPEYSKTFTGRYIVAA